MNSFVRLTAKSGCEEQINAAYAAMRGDPLAWLVYTEALIKAEIALIHSPEGANSFAHVRASLHDVADWNRIFPEDTCGMGHLRLPRELQIDAKGLAEIRRDLEFIVEHEALFSQVIGLEEARSRGLLRKSARSPRTHTRAA